MGLAAPTRWAEVDLGAIRDNVTLLRRLLPPPLRLCAVVKADAYGHGAVEVGRAVLAAGADWLCVATPTEGLQLVAAGIEAPVFNMGPTPENEMVAAVGAGLRLCVYDREAIVAAAAAAAGTGRVARLHLKVDTGMARLGCARGGEAVELARLIESEPGLELEGFWTHLAEADDLGSSRTNSQLRLFLEEVQRLAQAGITPGMLHCCNSAGALLHPEARFDMVRCGLPMYGYASARDEAVEAGLRPALTWKARVVAVRHLDTGDRVGYGGTFTAARRLRLATVSVGYGDGYPRSLSNRGTVLIRGRRLPLVGRVSMDFVTADATELEDLQVGEEAVVLGRQVDATLGADELAGWLETIPWEVLCQVGKRVPRVYVNG